MANITTNNMSQERMRMAEVLNVIVVNIYFTVSIELRSVTERIRDCSTESFIMEHKNKLASKQQECLNDI